MAFTFARMRCAAILGALLLFGGCSFVDKALLPSLTGEFGDSTPRTGTLLLGGTDFETPDIDDSETSATPAGQRVRALRGDLTVLKEHVDLTNRVLQRLRGELHEAATEYEELRDSLRDDLRRRTPPGADEVAQRRAAADSALDRVSQSVQQLRSLLKEASSNSAEAGALAEAATLAASALDAQGEDQEQLQILQDETSRMASVAYRLQSQLSEDIVQSSDYLMVQRSLLAQIAPGGAEPELPVLTGGLPDEPLVIIRFDKPDVDYAAVVDEAVVEALRGRPTARVQLVAIAPESDTDPNAPQRARERLKKVLNTLVAAGVPASRIDLSARTSPDTAVDEVQIFVR